MCIPFDMKKKFEELEGKYDYQCMFDSLKELVEPPKKKKQIIFP